MYRDDTRFQIPLVSCGLHPVSLERLRISQDPRCFSLPLSSKLNVRQVLSNISAACLQQSISNIHYLSFEWVPLALTTAFITYLVFTVGHTDVTIKVARPIEGVDERRFAPSSCYCNERPPRPWLGSSPFPRRHLSGSNTPKSSSSVSTNPLRNARYLEKPTEHQLSWSSHAGMPSSPHPFVFYDAKRVVETRRSSSWSIRIWTNSFELAR